MQIPHLCVVSAVAGLAMAAAAQSISVLQPAPGFQHSAAFYVSPGGAIVGISTNSGLYSPQPTRWSSVSSAAEALGVPSIGPGQGAEPYRCSDDGQVVAGRWTPDQNTSTPIMWGASGAYTSLPGPGSPSVANGVSADGSIVTGWSATSQGRWLLRWQGGVQTAQIGPLFLPGPCSPDGSMALGVTYLGGSAAALSRWTSAGGPNGSVQTIMNFPATWTGVREPNAMTPTGDAAVGMANTNSPTAQSYIWRNGQFSAMGLLAGYETMSAQGITADGSLVVGSGSVLIQPNSYLLKAVVWTPAVGWQQFADWLAGRGVSFPGWSFSQLRSVTPDGLTFAGSGISPLGESRGFVVTIPAPGAGIVAMVGMFALGVRRRR